MATGPEFRIAVIRGDGVGKEEVDTCLAVLDAVERNVGGFHLAYRQLLAGAEHYRETGVDMTDESFEQVRRAGSPIRASATST